VALAAVGLPGICGEPEALNLTALEVFKDLDLKPKLECGRTGGTIYSCGKDDLSLRNAESSPRAMAGPWKSISLTMPEGRMVWQSDGHGVAAGDGTGKLRRTGIECRVVTGCMLS